jgi:RNA polymerase sigma-70 factor (ECF subfamily)
MESMENYGVAVMAGPAELRLVEQAQRGDSQALGQLYQRHVDRVYSYIVFRVRDESLAEDLTQDVFFQAIRALDGFDWRGAVAPWLLRIARNTVIDHWRRSARRPEWSMSALEDDDEDDDRRLDRIVAEGDDEAMSAVEFLVDRVRISAAAEHLTELQRQVVALRFASGLSIKETADVMGKSEGAIKNLQHHALRALRKHLAGYEAAL